MSRTRVLTDGQWGRISGLMPSSDGKRGKPFRDHRQVVEGIIYRYRTGVAWRDLPSEFGPWQTVWKRLRRLAGDGTWDRVLAVLLAEADVAGKLGWKVSVDSTVKRGAPARVEPDPGRARHKGAGANHKNLLIEPADHAPGGSRGGLSTTSRPRPGRTSCRDPRPPSRAGDRPLGIAAGALPAHHPAEVLWHGQRARRRLTACR